MEADKLAHLSQHWLLAHLDPVEMQRLVRHVRVQRYAADDVIFRKGDPGLGMMAVLKGRVKIVSSSPNDREVLLNIIDEGEVFGEIALLDGNERTADAVAMEPTELLALDRRDFLPFIERHPEVSMKLVQVLCGRLRRTTEQLEETIFLVQSARLAKTLVRLARQYGEKTARGVRIGLMHSQRELGTLVGMRREAVNRQLARWEDEGIIARDDGRVVIPDLDTLEDLAEELMWQGLD